jgi:hypothetical protein
VFAAIELGAGTVEEVSATAGLPPPRATTALGRLTSVGVIVADPSGRFEVAAEALRRAAREALARPPRDEHAGSPAAVRRVLDAFVVDGRIEQLPAAHAKRRVVLDWLAQRFEPGRRYPEADVNALLREHLDDVAAGRRYLVDEGFLDRDGGEYWRTGGSVRVDDDLTGHRFAPV